MGSLFYLERPVYLITSGSMVTQPSVQRALLGSHTTGQVPVPLAVMWWRNRVGAVLGQYAIRYASVNNSRT